MPDFRAYSARKAYSCVVDCIDTSRIRPWVATPSCENHSIDELYVGVLSVKVFVKIVDSVFVYGGECVVNVT